MAAALPRVLLLCLGCLSVSQAWAEACVVHSQGERLAVQVCQENRTIPSQLFRDGFCKPQLKEQKVAVEFVEQCPSGAFGVCRNAKSEGAPYRQDVHYYGVASDALYLKPYCEQLSQGQWQTPE